MPHYEDYRQIKDFDTNEQVRMLARIIGEMSIFCGYLEVTQDNYRTIQKRLRTWAKATGSTPLMNSKTKEGVHISISMVKAVIGLKMSGRWASEMTDKQFAREIKRVSNIPGNIKRREALKCQA
jgi:hypothetical protein